MEESFSGTPPPAMLEAADTEAFLPTSDFRRQCFRANGPANLAHAMRGTVSLPRIGQRGDSADRPGAVFVN